MHSGQEALVTDFSGNRRVNLLCSGTVFKAAVFWNKEPATGTLYQVCTIVLIDLLFLETSILQPFIFYLVIKLIKL